MTKLGDNIDDLVDALGSADGAGLRDPLGGNDTGPAYKIRQVTSNVGGVERQSKVRDLNFDLHHKVFVTFVPYRNCKRCLDDLDNATVELPQTGRYCCPHTDLAAYEELLRRNAHEGVRITERTTSVQKDGTVMVVLHYAEPTGQPKSKTLVTGSSARRRV